MPDLGPMTDDEREAAVFARIDSWGGAPGFPIHSDMRFLRRRIEELRAAHDARATVLLAANNVEVERRRAAEARLERALPFLLRAFYRTSEELVQWYGRPQSLLDGRIPNQMLAEGKVAEIFDMLIGLHDGIHV
jgi:hypothetical protein